MFSNVLRLWGLKEAYLMALAYSAALSAFIYFSVIPPSPDSYVLQGGFYFLATLACLVLMGFIHAGFLEPYFAHAYLLDGEEPVPYWHSVREGMQSAGWKVAGLYFMYFVLNFIGTKVGGLIADLGGNFFVTFGILVNISLNLVACVWLIVGATVLVRKSGQPAGRNIFASFAPSFRIYGGSFLCVTGFFISQLALLMLYCLVLSIACQMMMFLVPGWAVLPAGFLLSMPFTAYLWAVGVGLSVRLNILKMTDESDNDHTDGKASQTSLQA